MNAATMERPVAQAAENLNPVAAATSALILQEQRQFDLSPRNFDEAWRMAEYLADSDMVPKDFKGKPANCLVAIQWGAELGLKTMQAIQNIAVINGRPSLWGDVMLALVRNSPLCEYVIEGWYPDGTAWCKAKRRGEPEQIREYSTEDAKTAGLHGKAGPWTTGPKRMRQMRARGWALRDVFTDVLKGLHLAEEAMDLPPVPEKFMGPADVVTTSTPAAPPPPPAPAAARPAWTDEQIASKASKMRELFQAGRTLADVIAFYDGKAKLSEQQKASIAAIHKQVTTPAAEAPAEAPAAAPAQDAQDAAPAETYASVAHALAHAGNADDLAAATDRIRFVANPEHRTELTAIAQKREMELA